MGGTLHSSGLLVHVLAADTILWERMRAWDGEVRAWDGEVFRKVKSKKVRG